jgi:hypothetical protein
LLLIPSLEEMTMMVRVIGAFGLGALVMYFFDPVSGKRRRALARDQLVHARHEIGDYAEGTTKDLRNRAYGLVAEARSLVERRLGERRSASSVDIDLSQP